jgi:hypothetical protein
VTGFAFGAGAAILVVVAPFISIHSEQMMGTGLF